MYTSYKYCFVKKLHFSLLLFWILRILMGLAILFVPALDREVLRKLHSHSGAQIRPMRTFDWLYYRGKRTYFRRRVFWTLLVTRAVCARTFVTIHLIGTHCVRSYRVYSWGNEWQSFNQSAHAHGADVCISRDKWYNHDNSQVFFETTGTHPLTPTITSSNLSKFSWLNILHDAAWNEQNDRGKRANLSPLECLLSKSLLIGSWILLNSGLETPYTSAQPISVHAPKWWRPTRDHQS